jgi:hypothetical protein
MLSRKATTPRRRLLTMVTLLMLATVLPGCSLFVMAGKMFFGNPKSKCAFHRSTGVDLTEGRNRVLIVCNTPYGIGSEYPTLRMDIVEHMTRDLQQRNVDIVPADDAAAWVDEHGGWGDLNRLAERFDADYLVDVEVQSFSIGVPGSDELYQGKLAGRVQVTDFTGKSGPRTVMEESCGVTWPRTPMHRDEMNSRQMFADRFVRDLSGMLSQLLYDYRQSEAVY